MLGSLAAIFIAIWFYTTARALGKNPVNWAAVGLLAYFIGATLWTFLVTPGLRDSVEHNQSYILGFIVRYGFVAVGFGCALWVKFKHLGKAP